MYNIYYNEIKALFTLTCMVRGHSYENYSTHKIILTQKFCNFWYKPGLMCTLTHLSDLAMVEDVIITCVCGKIYSITDWPGA